MSEIEDKVLGREKKKKAPVVPCNYFSQNNIWTVAKKGCGTSVINGVMAYEMLSVDGKNKARKGTKKILDNGFEFVRCS